MDLARASIVSPLPGTVLPPPYPDVFGPGVSASIVVTCAISSQGLPRDCLIGLPGSAAHPFILDALVMQYAQAARYPASPGNETLPRFGIFQITYANKENQRLLSVSTAWVSPYTVLLLRVAGVPMPVTLTYTCDSGVDGVLHDCAPHTVHPEENLRQMAVDQLDHTYYWSIAADGKPLPGGRHDFVFSF